MRDSRTTISLIADKDWMRTRVVGQPDEVFRYARECTGQNGSEHQANALSRRQRAEFCCRADILVFVAAKFPRFNHMPCRLSRVKLERPQTEDCPARLLARPVR